MRFLKLAIFIVFPLFFVGANIPFKSNSGKDILKTMLNGINAVKTQQCELATERLEGHLLFSESRINENPKKIYFNGHFEEEEGLFEAYEFYNLRINQRFANEFSKNFKGYSF
jgi:hypothetical protein